MWKDKCESYTMSSGKMKPYTLKGYVELSQIVRKSFMETFVELPDDTMGMTKEQIWITLEAINLESISAPKKKNAKRSGRR